MSPFQPTNCSAALEWLHARLDGDASALPDAMRFHLEDCLTCRERFRAAELFLGSRRVVVPAPIQLTERVVAAIKREVAHRRRNRFSVWTGIAAIAACVALWFGTRPPGPNDLTGIEPAQHRATAPPTFDVGEVGGAMASLSRRTAADIAEQGRLLLPDVAIPATLPKIEGTARPLDEARNGLTEGFEPVTSSARRAFGLLSAFAVETKN